MTDTTKAQILEVARKAIHTEMLSLKRMEDTLGDEFATAVANSSPRVSSMRLSDSISVWIALRATSRICALVVSVMLNES